MKWLAADIQYAPYERVAMRVLFATVVALHIPDALVYDKLPVPNGLARLLDLGFLLEPTAFSVSQYLLWGALVLYVLRIAWNVVLPYITLLSIAVGSIQNSQGAISHHLQIVPLVLLAQTAAHFYGRFTHPRTSGPEAENRVIHWSLQAIAATYLVSALTKLIHTGGRWIIQSPLVAVQIIKTTDQDYYNTLNPDRYNTGLALAEWMVRHPLLVAMIMGTGLLIELSAPLILLGRRWALAYGVALLLFHESVGRVMKLNFLYNEYLLWIYLVNIPFWTVFLVRWIGRSVPHSARASPD